SLTIPPAARRPQLQVLVSDERLDMRCKFVTTKIPTAASKSIQKRPAISYRSRGLPSVMAGWAPAGDGHFASKFRVTHKAAARATGLRRRPDEEGILELENLALNLHRVVLDRLDSQFTPGIVTLHRYAAVAIQRRLAFSRAEKIVPWNSTDRRPIDVSAVWSFSFDRAGRKFAGYPLQKPLVTMVTASLMEPVANASELQRS
ncbi:MAG TPA: hypothetical protein VLZ81_10305, partial [Blastocatellia bacterium]|nr:hypothetical protein [Blastocatellia bacterium]